MSKTKPAFSIIGLCLLLVLSLPSLGYALDVTLAWDANSETDLAGYKLYYGTTSGGPYNGSGSSDGGSPIVVPLNSLANPSSPEFTVHSLPDGITYFVLTAYNTEGLESGNSNEASTTSTVNRPPVLSPIGSRSIDEAQTLTFALTATDPDGDSLSYSAGNLPTGASFNPTTRTFTWTPGYGAAGNYSVLFTVTDNGTPPTSDSETVTITVGNVNRPPVLSPIGSRSIDEAQTLTFALTATDPDGDSLSYSAGNLPTGASFNPTTRTFTWTPGYGAAGNYSVLFTVTDNGTPPTSDSETVTITVGNVNRPPVLSPIGSRSIDEAQTLTFALTATDPDGDSLSYSAGNLPTGASFNPTTRTFTWTPGYGAAGNYSVLFTVTDNGTPPTSDSETVTITVGNVNRPPVLSPIGSRSIGEAQTLTFALTATDPDGDSLSYSAGNLPTGASFNPTTRTFTWTPGYGTAGNYSVLFTVTDNGTPPTSDSETVTITVGNVNRPPALSSLEVNGATGTSTVYANDPIGHVDIRIVASDDILVSQYLILDGNSNPNGGTFTGIPGGPRQNPIFTVTDFTLNNAEGNHTIYAWVKDDQGLVSSIATKTNVIVDNAGATVVGFPVINYTESSVTVTYSESNMQNATLASSYSLNNGLTLSGNGVDTSGIGKVFKLPLNPASLQRYLIYSLQIGSAVKDASGNSVNSSAIRINDDDNDGMADDWEKKWFGSIAAKTGAADSDGDGLLDVDEYNYARNNPAWGSNRWTLSPLSQDSDSDGIPDNYEVSLGLYPVSSSDRDLDFDGDGWSNYKEYLFGFSANDPTSHPQASIEILEVVPLDNAGIAPDTSRIPNKTAASVLLESTNGIDISNSQSVSLAIKDGERTYTRNTNDRNTNGQGVVRIVPLETNGNVAYSLWVSYFRTNETSIPNVYPYGATVEVTVQATDVNGFSLEPAFFSFRIESEEDARWAEENAPVTVVLEDTPVAGKKTITVQGGALDGASIIYDTSLAQDLGFEPEFGPIEEVPRAPGVGVPLNLLPPAVFANPVTLTIPCPGQADVSVLSVYYYDGREWWLACDAAGNVTPEGAGWMVPGSRVNHNEDQNSPAYIQIQIHHFSAAAAGGPEGSTAVESAPSVKVSGSSSVSDSGAGSGSGGCFISTIW